MTIDIIVMTIIKEKYFMYVIDCFIGYLFDIAAQKKYF